MERVNKFLNVSGVLGTGECVEGVGRVWRVWGRESPCCSRLNPSSLPLFAPAPSHILTHSLSLSLPRPQFFSSEGCEMVEMTCEEHDEAAASTQFVTHTGGGWWGCSDGGGGALMVVVVL